MTWEYGDDQDAINSLTAHASAMPFVSGTNVDLEHHHHQQQYHRWDIRDRILPQIEAGNLDAYDHWPNGSCRRAYDGLVSAEASHHASGWAMRNTNNHNAAILKKSCLGILVCTRRCADVRRKPSAAEVRLRPAICDKARRKQIGAHCPTTGCNGTLELRRCRGHAGYPVTHFWRTQGNTIFFQAKGFHDHPVPECWKAPLSKDRRAMKPKRKCRKRRSLTSFVHASDDAQAEEDEALPKRVKVEPTSPVVHLKSTEECIQATNRHDLITSSTQWAEFSAWSRAVNDRITVVNNNDDQQPYDVGSSPWQRPTWERVCKSDTMTSSPVVETPINYVSDCFRRAVCQDPQTVAYYPVCSESADCCDHRSSAACRRRLFHFSSVDDVLQPYINDGVTFAPTRRQPSCDQQLQLYPSPPLSMSTDSFTASPPETRFGDDDFLQHLRACADSEGELVGGGGVEETHPVRFSEMSNVDSSCFGQRPKTMTSEFYDRHTTSWNGDVVEYPMTMENFVNNNGFNDDIDDVLSVMADIVMGGSSLMPNYVF